MAGSNTLAREHSPSGGNLFEVHSRVQGSSVEMPNICLASAQCKALPRGLALNLKMPLNLEGLLTHLESCQLTAELESFFSPPIPQALVHTGKSRKEREGGPES